MLILSLSWSVFYAADLESSTAAEEGDDDHQGGHHQEDVGSTGVDLNIEVLTVELFASLNNQK